MVFIRAAEAKDIPSLQTLFLQLGYQTETAILAQRITAPQSMMSALVAETENAVCGVIVINFILPVHENRLWALISALVIEESSRGSGIGQQLLRAAERLARDKQCAQIELSSSEKESERINFMKITATRRFANASLNICLNRLRARAFPDDRNYILPSRIFNMRRRGSAAPHNS